MWTTTGHLSVALLDNARMYLNAAVERKSYEQLYSLFDATGRHQLVHITLKDFFEGYAFKRSEVLYIFMDISMDIHIHGNPSLKC